MAIPGTSPLELQNSTLMSSLFGGAMAAVRQTLLSQSLARQESRKNSLFLLTPIKLKLIPFGFEFAVATRCIVYPSYERVDICLMPCDAHYDSRNK